MACRGPVTVLSVAFSKASSFTRFLHTVKCPPSVLDLGRLRSIEERASTRTREWEIDGSSSSWLVRDRGRMA
jgi:hypothetical protein